MQKCKVVPRVKHPQMAQT